MTVDSENSERPLCGLRGDRGQEPEKLSAQAAGARQTSEEGFRFQENISGDSGRVMREPEGLGLDAALLMTFGWLGSRLRLSSRVFVSGLSSNSSCDTTCCVTIIIDNIFGTFSGCQGEGRSCRLAQGEQDHSGGTGFCLAPYPRTIPLPSPVWVGSLDAQSHSASTPVTPISQHKRPRTREVRSCAPGHTARI